MADIQLSPAQTGKHPKQLYILSFTEMWERFGYYLMVGILFLYFHTSDKVNGIANSPFSGKGWTNERAGDVVGSFIALVYLTPFIGGLLADRHLGYLKSIFF